MSTLQEMKDRGDIPEWMDQFSYDTISKGYLLEGETVRNAVERISKASAGYLEEDENVFAPHFFKAIWNGWLCLASPIWANMGTTRGLPISCNVVSPEDSLNSIMYKANEMAMLTKYGAGLGCYLGDLRASGSIIKGNGRSEGIIPWATMYDKVISVVSQAGVRRGSIAMYLPIDHGDYSDFLQLRRNTGDSRRRVNDANLGACISDKFMNEMLDGNKVNQQLWRDTLVERFQEGEPYLLFTDNVNRHLSPDYIANNFKVKSSNLCNEVMQVADNTHTMVCCLSSLNLARFDEWDQHLFHTEFGDMTLEQLATWFLDGVMSEYISKAERLNGLECSVRSAVKGRALGLGVLGFHTYLQSKMWSMEGFDAIMFNNIYFQRMRREQVKASLKMGEVFGPPEWCIHSGMRNSLLSAIAPTATNSIIVGGVSPGIEPVSNNIASIKSAKGTFVRVNPILEIALKDAGIDINKIMNEMIKSNGSIQNIKGIPDDIKKVFKTPREINQHAIVKLAGLRQKHLDQSQSLNLFVYSNASAKYIHEVHLAAWQQGVKGLYYLRSESSLGGGSETTYKSKEDCEACQG
jgi:ribonucleoside-diphosphate reductase alpha chain